MSGPELQGGQQAPLPRGAHHARSASPAPRPPRPNPSCVPPQLGPLEAPQLVCSSAVGSARSTSSAVCQPTGLLMRGMRLRTPPLGGDSTVGATEPSCGRAVSSTCPVPGGKPVHAHAESPSKLPHRPRLPQLRTTGSAGPSSISSSPKASSISEGLGQQSRKGSAETCSRSTDAQGRPSSERGGSRESEDELDLDAWVPWEHTKQQSPAIGACGGNDDHVAADDQGATENAPTADHVQPRSCRTGFSESAASLGKHPVREVDSRYTEISTAEVGGAMRVLAVQVLESSRQPCAREMPRATCIEEEERGGMCSTTTQCLANSSLCSSRERPRVVGSDEEEQEQVRRMKECLTSLARCSKTSPAGSPTKSRPSLHWHPESLSSSSTKALDDEVSALPAQEASQTCCDSEQLEEPAEQQVQLQPDALDSSSKPMGPESGRKSPRSIAETSAGFAVESQHGEACTPVLSTQDAGVAVRSVAAVGTSEAGPSEVEAGTLAALASQVLDDQAEEHVEDTSVAQEARHLSSPRHEEDNWRGSGDEASGDFGLEPAAALRTASGVVDPGGADERRSCNVGEREDCSTAALKLRENLFEKNAADHLLKQLHSVCRHGSAEALERYVLGDSHRASLPKLQRQSKPLPQISFRTEPTLEELEARETRRKERLERHLEVKKAQAARFQKGSWDPCPAPPSLRDSAASTPKCTEVKSERGDFLPPLQPKPPRHRPSGSASTSSLGNEPREVKEAKQFKEVCAVAAPYGRAFAVAAARQRQKGAISKSTSLPAISRRQGDRNSPNKKMAAQ